MSDVKGKCFSFVNQGQRNKDDFYQTPYSLTRLLLDNEPILLHLNPTILEPAAGKGAIVRVIEERIGKPFNASLTHYDLSSDGIDFFRETTEYDAIITNPPYRQAGAFIKKAKTVARKYIAMLLPLSYLHGKERLDSIWSDREFPLARVLVFSRFPMLTAEIREDGKHETGMQVYAWYIWQRNYSAEPVIRWLDNDPYVVRKGDRNEEA